MKIQNQANLETEQSGFSGEGHKNTKGRHGPKWETKPKSLSPSEQFTRQPKESYKSIVSFNYIPYPNIYISLSLVICMREKIFYGKKLDSQPSTLSYKCLHI